MDHLIATFAHLLIPQRIIARILVFDPRLFVGTIIKVSTDCFSKIALSITVMCK